MLRLFSFLKKHIPAVLVILVFLVVQAYCDLGLPQYTSDIVDIGIQQGGIENAVPKVMRESAMQHLKLFLTDKEDAVMEAEYEFVEKGDSSYQKEYPLVQTENLYVLSIKEEGKEKEEKTESLNSLLGFPMMLCSNMEKMTVSDLMKQMQEGSMGAGTAAQKPSEAAAVQQNMMEQLVDGLPNGMESDAFSYYQLLKDNGMFTDEMVLSMRKAMEEAMGGLSGSMIDQMAVRVVKAEYKAVGVDLDKLQMDYLWHMGRIMLLISFIMLAAAIVVGFFASKIGAAVGRELREKVFSNVMNFSNAEMDQFSTASLITRSTNDIQQVQMVSTMMLRMMLYAPILGIGGIIKVATTHTGMEWIIFVAVAVILGIVSALMVVTMPKFKRMQSLVDRLNLVSREILTGLPVIRAFSRERYEEKRFDKANEDLMKTQLFTNRVMSLMMPLMMLLMNFISVVIVWFGGKGIDAGELQVGDMMAFMIYTILIVMSFLMITMMSIMLPRAGVAADRIHQVIKTESTIEEKKDAKEAGKGGLVAFENVSFHYGNAKEDVVSGINFTAKPGETTAIIGSTGCGKSTLLHLLLRFYDVTGGKITVDGEDIRNLSLGSLRDRIGFVPQKGVLFSGTVASNLRYADEAITDGQIKEAASIAQSCGFIEEKKEGYESPIAQGGSNVSGGQKQRLSIARAIAKAPKIYLFDDSFSALDYKTDIALRKALKEKTGDSTVIIVAQRISTILHAEQIVVLDDGEIAGIGTHEELMQSCEAYQEIAHSQLSEKELSKTEVPVLE